MIQSNGQTTETINQSIMTTEITEENIDNYPVDPRIVYPSYKSFDDFIDVERLRSLDGYITQKIKRRMIAQNDYRFYTGPYRLQNESPEHPGTKMIYLAYSEKPDNYFDLDRTELWHPSPDANEFALLMDFIRTLPFKATGRMMIMYDNVARPVTAHRDHIETELCHEFIWFRTNLRKPFYMLNHITGEKLYVDSHSAWFDSVNQFHGSDPVDGLSFSIRVDGIFTDEFKALIPKPDINIASIPSYWASFENKNDSRQ
ncbi:MAG: hypothetical protein JWN60_2131 [Acidobacteria bacterium]|jgi:hypothetical protein|nr:hypothetical protein [Acidobacteriota bacterium]